MSSVTRPQSGIFYDRDESLRRDLYHDATQPVSWREKSTIPSQKYLPLLEVTLTAEVAMFTSTTILTQIFQNNSMRPIREAKYAFPLYENSAIVSFTCNIEGKARCLKGVVKPNEVARRDYNTASSEGRSAGLLEEHTPDIFTTTLGNIPAKSTVRVEIIYIGELKHDLQHDIIKLRIPTSIAPRYGNPPNCYLDADSVQVVDKGLKIEINVVTTHPIRDIESHNHPITYGFDNAHTSWASFLAANISPPGLRRRKKKMMKATVRLSQTTISFDKDFVLEIKMAHRSLSKSQAVVETHSRLLDHKAFMLTLSSEFAVSPIPQNRYPEIIFIADRSGSMMEKIATLKSSLEVFLRSIPENCRFNILSFGSSSDFLWKQSKPYSPETLKTASEYVSEFEANMGGTELLLALKRAAQSRLNGTTEVILLTDGLVWDLNGVIEFVKGKRQETRGKVRFFAMGVGDSVSHALVEGVARTGGGYAEVVSLHGQGRWEDRVVAMLGAALREALGSFKITFIKDREKIGEQDFIAGKKSFVSPLLTVKISC
jgi:hypothetical protein